MRFTVCVLLYGDYPQLASRLLGSLDRYADGGDFEVRIGCNQLSAESTLVVRQHLKEWGGRLCDWRHVYWSPCNVYKYPMMRRMLYTRPITTPYTMWFDDDSWIHPAASPAWFSSVADAMADADMAGSVWERELQGNQAAWIESRPWYAGKKFARGDRTKFCTGGWWTIRTEILQKWDWPDRDIVHFGGDQMLGVLCSQQGYRVKHFEAGVAINADGSGKCSSARRRGILQEKLVGVDYE
jgi:hypothetical protein